MISAMVEKQAIDLIVMGTHGRRGVKQLLLGSTAEEILRSAKTPLLMVGPETSVPPAIEAKPKRILRTAPSCIKPSIVRGPPIPFDISYLISTDLPCKESNQSGSKIQNEFVSGSSAKLLHVRKNQIGDGLSRTLEKHSRLPENGVKRKPVSRAT